MLWHDFLLSNGANFKDGQIMDFGSPEFETDMTLHRDIIVDLSHLAILEITGLDAEDFLQGQFTSDIKHLPVYKLQISAWCNPKGQVLINFFIFKHKSGFILLVPETMKSGFINRLQMYILRAHVEINDYANEITRIGIAGKNSMQYLADIIKNIPGEPGSIIQNEKVYCIHMPDNETRFVMFGEEQALVVVWEQLAEHLTPVGTPQWKLLDILSGYPWIDASTTEKFLPQMLNLDVLNGVSYLKGCYAGQEVIARLRYRGQNKRRLFLALIKQSEKPEHGVDLIIKDNEQNVGKVINSQASGDNEFMLLVVADIEAAKSNSIFIRGNNNKLEFQSLPYSIDV